MSDFRKRILVPLTIPVSAIVFIGGLVWGMSRFLLATDKDMAVALAFVVSFGILLVCAFIANGRFGKVQGLALALLGLGIAAGGSVTAATLGSRAFEVHLEKPVATLVAKALKFDQQRIVISKTTEKEFNIELDNQDAGTLHNFALYKDVQFTQVVYKGKLFAGVKTEANQFENPGAGAYFFRCDVHPGTMTGTLVIGTAPAGGASPSPDASPSPGESPSPTATATAALPILPALLPRRRFP